MGRILTETKVQARFDMSNAGAPVTGLMEGPARKFDRMFSGERFGIPHDGSTRRRGPRDSRDHER